MGRSAHPVFHQLEHLVAAFKIDLPIVGVSTHKKVFAMVLHRVTRSICFGLCLGSSVGLVSPLVAAEPSAEVGTPGVAALGNVANLVLADSGTKKDWQKKGSTRKGRPARKSSKSPSGKSRSTRGKTRPKSTNPSLRSPGSVLSLN